MIHVPDQTRFYELQGSLSTTPEEEEALEEAREEGREGEHPERPGGAEGRPGPGVEREPVPERKQRGGRTRLPVWVRVSLIGVAVLLLALGIAGLFLPGLQGILTLMFALAVLSLVSRTMHRLLRWTLGPWPSLRKRVERHRRRSHTWLHDRVERFELWRRERRRRRWERRHGWRRPPDAPPAPDPVEPDRTGPEA